MRAVRFDEPGDPERVLRVGETPAPAVPEGHVLVRMLASPINPSDLLAIQGDYTARLPLPATPGFEGVGLVESGGGLRGWLFRGRRVAVASSAGGLWADWAVVPSSQIVPVPGFLSDTQAAAFFINPATAFILTRRLLRLAAGQWLLQTAAGSQVGRMVIRLGRHFGFHTLNVVRRREQVEELKQLGADVVLVQGDGPLVEQVRRQRPAGATHAIDAVGGELGSEVSSCLAPGGRHIVYGALADAPLSITARTLISSGVTLEGFWLGEWMLRQGFLSKLRLLMALRRLSRQGILINEIGQVYPLEEASRAVAAAQAPGKPGKVVLQISTR